MSRGSEDEWRGISIFRSLEAPLLAEVMKASYVQNFPPDVTLFWPGTAITFVHAVLSGDVELSASHADRTYTMMLRPCGSLLPLNHVVGSDIATFKAITATRSRIALVPALLVRGLVDRDPGFALVLLRELSALNEALVHELHSRNLQKSRERLASWIVSRLTSEAEEQELVLSLQKKMLAAAIGVSQATLSRDIEQLEAHGIVVEGRRIRVISRSALVRAANALPNDPGAAAAPWRSSSSRLGEEVEH